MEGGSNGNLTAGKIIIQAGDHDDIEYPNFGLNSNGISYNKIIYIKKEAGKWDNM